MNDNTTAHRDASQILELIEHTLAGHVDLDGCMTAADIKAAIIRDNGEWLLDSVLDGDYDSTIGRWLEERGDDITVAMVKRDYPALSNIKGLSVRVIDEVAKVLCSNESTTEEQESKSHQSDELIDLYQRMANLTKPKCGQCRIPYYCCLPEHCEATARYAAELGVMLNRTDHPRLPFLGPEGCTVLPHLRPICTVHVCDNHLWDQEFSNEYFELRDALSDMDIELEKEPI